MGCQCSNEVQMKEVQIQEVVHSGYKYHCKEDEQQLQKEFQNSIELINKSQVLSKTNESATIPSDFKTNKDNLLNSVPDFKNSNLGSTKLEQYIDANNSQEQLNKKDIGKTTEENDLGRAKGCLFGAFLGDSIGSRLEGKKDIKEGDFMNAIKMNEEGIYQLVPGQLTDDGELIIAQAQGVLNNTPTSPEIKEIMKKIIESYFEWINSNPFDFEATMQNSWNFLLFKEDDYARKMQTDEMISLLHQSVQKNSLESQSNSFLMKQSPLAIFLQDQPLDIIFEFAIQDTLLTHCHPVKINQILSYLLIFQFCLDVSRIYIYSLSQLVKRGNDVKLIVRMHEKIFCFQKAHFQIYCECRQLIWSDLSFNQQTRDIFSQVESLFPEISDECLLKKKKPKLYKQIQSLQEHLSNKLSCIQRSLYLCLVSLLKDEIKLEDLFKDIFHINGVTGTDLCIIGALVGARHGISIFDSKFVDIVNKCNPNENIKQKRPTKYSPSLYGSLAVQLIEKSKNQSFNLKPKKIFIEKDTQNIGKEYEGKNFENLNDEKIDFLQNCEISRMSNCQINKIVNCFINNVEQCEINNIISSRITSIKSTHVKEMNNCLVECNEGRIAYDQTKIDKHVNCFFQVQITI